jgi:hypothetical protein
MGSSNEFWLAQQKFRKEMRLQMLRDFEENCEHFPVEMMSSEDIRGSSLYATTKKDFYFSMDKLNKFEEIYRTLHYFPVNQSNLRFWKRLVFEVFRYINYNVVPKEYNLFAIEFLSLERIIRGIQIFVLLGSETELSIEGLANRLGMSQEHLLFFIPNSKFESGSPFTLTDRTGLSMETGKFLFEHPFSYSVETFDLGEGGLFKPEFIYMLKTLAKRRSPGLISQIREDVSFYLTDFKRLTWGIVPVNKYTKADGSLLHPFPAYDNLLCRIITKEEYLEIYGI